ncbi:hypothetical protein F5Y09DRAFT_306977 [Xylaria sp. FL1042]|nr:hypothetical protein F5Y09DRAFT_306977 [Xylaria sp. FL1042]
MSENESAERGTSTDDSTSRKAPLLGIRLNQTPHPISRILSSIFLPDDLVLFKDTRRTSRPTPRRRDDQSETTPLRSRYLLAFIVKTLPSLLLLLDVVALLVFVSSIPLAVMIKYSLPSTATQILREDLIDIAAHCTVVTFVWLLLLLASSAAVASWRRLLAFIRFYEPGPRDGDNGYMNRETNLEYLGRGYFLLLLARYPDYFTSLPLFLRRVLNPVYVGYCAYARWTMASALVPWLLQEGKLGYKSLDDEPSHIVTLQEEEFFGPANDGKDPSDNGGADVSVGANDEVDEIEYLVMWIPRYSDKSRLECFAAYFLRVWKWIGCLFVAGYMIAMAKQGDLIRI